jgi:two-component system, LytTR family, response regulator
MTTALKQPVLTCFVVSENHYVRNHILRISRELPNMEVIAVCETKEQQHAEINQKTPDVIFWDKAAIYASSAECLHKLTEKPQIVLLSEPNGQGLDLPDYLVTTEIVQPFDNGKFTKAMALVAEIKDEKERLRLKRLAPTAEQKTPSTAPDYIFLRIEGRVTRFNVEEILYFQGHGDYVIMKTSRGDFKLNTIMKKLVSKLEHPLFLKTHRAFVINVSKINHIEENVVVIGSDAILISRAHKALVREKLNII